MTSRLQGRVALVTCGCGGAGRAVCERFEAEGAIVHAADLSAAGSLGEASTSGEFMRLDVTSETEVQQAMATVEAEHGALDVLANAAGIEMELTIEETSLEQWNRIMAINGTGTFFTSKYALPLLRKSSHASIIDFGPYDGYIADPKLAAYCATKGAVHALTKAMACDHGQEGIRVNAICPGYIDTPMNGARLGDGCVCRCGEEGHLHDRSRRRRSRPLSRAGAVRLEPGAGIEPATT